MPNHELYFSEACFQSCPKVHIAICTEIGRQAMGLVSKSDRFVSIPDLRIAIGEAFEDDPSFVYQECDGPITDAESGLPICGRGVT